MAQANPVLGWDAKALLVSETTFGTTPAPANVAAYAARALEFIDLDLGPIEVGAVRPKKDRSLGRGMQAGFVEGRVQPIPFSIGLAVKSRSAIDGAPKEAALYAAAGVKSTTNSSTSVVLSLDPTPVENSIFSGVSIERPLGEGAALYEKEILRGGVVKSLRWEGGDKELMLKASGAGIGKYASGSLESITLGTAGGTTLTHTAEESYRLAPGYYACESEIISIAQASDIGFGTTSTTIARAALSSSGAAHSAKQFRPYLPSGIAYAGSPISETTCTVTVGGVTFRVMSWFLELATGMEHLPGESGSKYVQGVKTGRYDVKVGMKLVLSADQVALLGKVTQRPVLALSISQGTGTGGIWTASIPYTEAMPMSVPAPLNDVSIIDVAFRVRDNTSSDSLSITLT